MLPDRCAAERISRITANVPTPFLLIEEEIFQENLRRIHAYADLHGFSVRPHVKTHKSLVLARMQMAAGAVGIAVAKAGEAEVMSQLGNPDITVAYPVIGEAQARRLAGLARTHTIRVAVDSVRHMQVLAAAARQHRAEIGIHIIFDTGLHRCGVAGPDQMTALARFAENTAGIRYEGIQMYQGQLYGKAASDPNRFEQIDTLWETAYDALCRAGLKPGIVSSGSTPSLFNTHRIRHVNEIRVGTAVLNDYFVLKFNHCSLESCALRLVATVVSDTVPGQVIIDAGSKALSAKQLLRREILEMGRVLEYPDAVIFRLHEEHGWVDVSRCSKLPRAGERLTIIPVNAALCMNLFDSFRLLTSSGRLEHHSIEARGRCV